MRNHYTIYFHAIHTPHTTHTLFQLKRFNVLMFCRAFDRSISLNHTYTHSLAHSLFYSLESFNEYYIQRNMCKIIIVVGFSSTSLKTTCKCTFARAPSRCIWVPVYVCNYVCLCLNVCLFVCIISVLFSSSAHSCIPHFDTTLFFSTFYNV